jgi:hypothetical protein
LADGIMETLGELFHLIQTNIMCMVGIMVFGIVLAIVIVIWYMRKIMNREISVYGKRMDKDKK